jgi:hypothetical protein
VKLVNKLLVNDVVNLFTIGKDKGAKPAGLYFISHSTEVHIIINMTVDILRTRKWQILYQYKGSFSKLF